jgi:hypothetical protein
MPLLKKSPQPANGEGRTTDAKALPGDFGKKNSPARRLGNCYQGASTIPLFQGVASGPDSL